MDIPSEVYLPFRVVALIFILPEGSTELQKCSLYVQNLNFYTD